MEGETIPRATMNSFIKSKLEGKVSGEFTDSMLYLAKQFIFRVTDKANQICEEKQKKTINSEHLYEAMQSLGMEDHVEVLKQSQKDLIEDNKAKQQYRQKVQDNLDLIMKKSSSLIAEQPPTLLVRDSFQLMKQDQEEMDQQNYEEQSIREDSQKEVKDSAKKIQAMRLTNKDQDRKRSKKQKETYQDQCQKGKAQ